MSNKNNLKTLVSNKYIQSSFKRKAILSVLSGGFLAGTFVCGRYLHYENTLLDSFGQVLLLALIVLGAMLLCVPLFFLLLTGMEYFSDRWQKAESQDTTSRFLFVKYWAILFACNIPLFLHLWPVNFIFDAKYQMAEVLTGSYKLHHPLLHTLLMGGCYKLGQSLGNVSLGMSFYTIVQMLILSASFAYAMVYLYKKGTPKMVRIALLLVYGLTPINPIFAVTATKDVLFAAFFLFFFIITLKVCFDQEKLNWKTITGFILSCTLMILFRKNALYALVLSLPFFILARKGKKHKGILLLLLLSSMALAFLSDKILASSLHAVSDGNIREVASVPLQQMARVACYYGDELEPEVYQEILTFWPEEAIASYNPYLSDPIKGSIDLFAVKDNLFGFLKLWIKLGLSYPGEYIESFLTNTLGFWYLGDVEYAMASGDDIAAYHTLIGLSEEIEKKALWPVFPEIFDYLFYEQGFRNIPILNYLFRCSTYLWLLVVYATYALYQKEYNKLFIISLLVAYFASCFFGPWVALRYIYNIIVCCPVLIALAMRKTPKPLYYQK